MNTQELQLSDGQDFQHGKILTFSIGQEVFGIDIVYVKEIIGMQPVSALPESPDYLIGIINLRGKIIPVVDVRIKFGKDKLGYTDRTCIIVTDIQGVSTGLLVDRVSEVITVDDENIIPASEYSFGNKNRYIRSIAKVGNDVKLLIDCNQFFKEEELDDILVQ
jgi:purine-binding chemotaxis protein CheW